MIPWLARAKPEELFLPQAWTERIVPPRGVDEVVQWLAPYAAQCHGVRRGEMRREAPKVGRNEACACGSGKKYKRCCAGVEKKAA